MPKWKTQRINYSNEEIYNPLSTENYQCDISRRQPDIKTTYINPSSRLSDNKLKYSKPQDKDDISAWNKQTQESHICIAAQSAYWSKSLFWLLGILLNYRETTVIYGKIKYTASGRVIL